MYDNRSNNHCNFQPGNPNPGILEVRQQALSDASLMWAAERTIL